MKSLSRVRLLVTPWTAAHQAPPSMGFSRQKYWSGVPLPSPGTGVGGTQNPQQKSLGGFLRPQRRKVIHQHRFSLASLGGACALNQTPLSSSLREQEGPLLSNPWILPLLHLQGQFILGYSSLFLHHARSLSLEYAQIFIHLGLRKYLLSPFSVPGTVP